MESIHLVFRHFGLVERQHRLVEQANPIPAVSGNCALAYRCRGRVKRQSSPVVLRNSRSNHEDRRTFC